MNLFFLCMKIFMARILDVSIGTVRTIFMVKGKISITSILAFIEVYVWFWVAREALVTKIDSIIIPISYSLGYATGTFIGTFISNKYIRGIIKIEIIINKKNSNELIKKLKEYGYGLSVIELKDNDNYLIVCQINKKYKKEIINIINNIDGRAFVTINNTNYLHNGFIK